MAKPETAKLQGGIPGVDAVLLLHASTSGHNHILNRKTLEIAHTLTKGTYNATKIRVLQKGMEDTAIKRLGLSSKFSFEEAI